MQYYIRIRYVIVEYFHGKEVADDYFYMIPIFKEIENLEK